MTLSPAARYEGSLVGVPCVYVHRACGAYTTMPVEIIRSYLANPFLYGDETFCAGCSDYVPHRDCFWETGQSLQAYFDALRAAASPALRARAHEHYHGGVDQ
ncbi:hypothetical protein Cch01nite_14760 [Cellulomonas chitinilytica]|uniref:Uncharacterized protein n=1 Tax=Cellulomonas chitinilytica TaxID=398759 RepID=A0A919U1R3_9CELL|nr:hypothetical protein [Cellulomonas chitinilytica]GIG20752.1 hypothetical protein Cch01nite_14760 [Cellulomonas chitinilytica]